MSRDNKHLQPSQKSSKVQAAPMLTKNVCIMKLPFELRIIIHQYALTMKTAVTLYEIEDYVSLGTRETPSDLPTILGVHSAARATLFHDFIRMNCIKIDGTASHFDLHKVQEFEQRHHLKYTKGGMLCVRHVMLTYNSFSALYCLELCENVWSITLGEYLSEQFLKESISSDESFALRRVRDLLNSLRDLKHLKNVIFVIGDNFRDQHFEGMGDAIKDIQTRAAEMLLKFEVSVDRPIAG